MTPEELKSLAQASAEPARPDSHWEEFPGRVVAGLRAGARPAAASRHLELAIALAAAAACGLMAGFALWHGNTAKAGTFESLRDGRMLRAQLVLYAGRLEAIVHDRGGLRTQLATAPSVATADPVCVEIRDGDERQVVVTFSGQPIQLADRTVMVLSDGGQVILVGRDFLWTPSGAAGAATRLQIRAALVPPEPSPTPKPTETF
jgi:hypothetical protein